MVLLNCRDNKLRAQSRAIIDKWHVEMGEEMDTLEIREYSHLLGVPASINTGVKEILKRWPDTERIMVCDDDCLAPPPDLSLHNAKEGIPEFWAEALSIMLEAGWKVVGHPSRNTFYNESTLREIGGVKGHKASHVAGAFSGFSVETWKKSGGIPSAHKLYGFGPFCHQFQGKVAWSPDKRFTVVDFDRLGHPWSLRDGEYWDWYNYMRPNKAIAIERKK
jgi:hypothetical protein